jgi:muconate cycloisomerase
MKITAIEAHVVRVPLKPERLMITTLGQHAVSYYVLVRVATDAGLEGAGEATVDARWSGETAWGAKLMIEDVFQPALLGCNPAEIAEIDRRMDAAAAHNWFAKSAIEMACWDLCGQAAGKPVYELLGGACRPLTIRSRYSLGAYEASHAARRACELVAEGFTTIKIKVGRDPQADVARVRAVREAVGPQIDLTIDANCGWDAETAIHCLKQLQDCRLVLVEQPTAKGDYAAMARVREVSGLPIMADESCFDLVHARELVRNRCCDVISVYPGKQGGIRKAREIVEFAARHGVACSIGSNLELDVATAAMAHLIVAAPNMQVERFPGDLLGPDYHAWSVVQDRLEIRGPLTTITNRPGLGVCVDWQRVRSGEWSALP